MFGALSLIKICHLQNLISYIIGNAWGFQYCEYWNKFYLFYLKFLTPIKPDLISIWLDLVRLFMLLFNFNKMRLHKFWQKM